MGGVSAVTHLLFVAASVLSGNPRLGRMFTGVYFPFHSIVDARFIPSTSPPSGTPGRTFHPRHTVQAGYRFCASTQALARHITCYASAMWVEFPQTCVCNCSPTRQPRAEHSDPE